jgi:hypothetical protein
MSGDVRVRFREHLGGGAGVTRLVCCFQYREDEQRFSKDIGMRLGKFKLELSVEKTKVIKFTRFETEGIWILWVDDTEL